MYEARTYREVVNHQLNSRVIVDEESDLLILYDNDIEDLPASLAQVRTTLKTAIAEEPAFLTSLVPLPARAKDPEIIRRMKSAAEAAGVGPMAAVAGAVSEALGAKHGTDNADLIIENGGDLFIKTSIPRLSLIHAGRHPLSDRLALRITPATSPLGICTSSGTMGHSLSFGKADAVVAVSDDVLLADASATAIANRVSTAGDIPEALHFAQSIPGLLGVVILVEDEIGVWGDLDLVPVNEKG